MSNITEVIVSFRIPSKLVEQLKQSPDADQFLDTSEMIRSIVRKNWLVSKDPIMYEIKKLKRELKEEIRRGNSE